MDCFAFGCRVWDWGRWLCVSSPPPACGSCAFCWQWALCPCYWPSHCWSTLARGLGRRRHVLASGGDLSRRLHGALRWRVEHSSSMYRPGPGPCSLGADWESRWWHCSRCSRRYWLLGLECVDSRLFALPAVSSSRSRIIWAPCPESSSPCAAIAHWTSDLLATPYGWSISTGRLQWRSGHRVLFVPAWAHSGPHRAAAAVCGLPRADCPGITFVSWYSAYSWKRAAHHLAFALVQWSKTIWGLSLMAYAPWCWPLAGYGHLHDFLWHRAACDFGQSTTWRYPSPPSSTGKDWYVRWVPHWPSMRNLVGSSTPQTGGTIWTETTTFVFHSLVSSWPVSERDATVCDRHSTVVQLVGGGGGRHVGRRWLCAGAPLGAQFTWSCIRVENQSPRTLDHDSPWCSSSSNWTISLRCSRSQTYMFGGRSIWVLPRSLSNPFVQALNLGGRGHWPSCREWLIAALFAQRRLRNILLPCAVH